MKKYGSPEPGRVLGKEEHETIWGKLKKIGKKSVGDMTEEEKAELEKEMRSEKQ